MTLPNNKAKKEPTEVLEFSATILGGFKMKMTTDADPIEIKNFNGKLCFNDGIASDINLFLKIKPIEKKGNLSCFDGKSIKKLAEEKFEVKKALELKKFVEQEYGIKF